MSSFTVKDILLLPRELRGAAYIELAKGKQIRNLRGLASHIIHRENRPSGFVSLDERDGDDYSLNERIEACDPADLLEYKQSRIQKFDDQTESVIDTIRGGAAQLGRDLGISARRGQQIVKKQIEDVLQARSFEDGDIGQGSLFNFNGEKLV
jgi:hypothetical protein